MEKKGIEKKEESQGFSKDGFKEAVQAEVRKMENVGDIVSGVFIGMERSMKFQDSWALRFNNAGTSSVVFINQQGRALFEDNGIVKGDHFILELAEKRPIPGRDSDFNVFKLYFKKMSRDQ